MDGINPAIVKPGRSRCYQRGILALMVLISASLSLATNEARAANPAHKLQRDYMVHDDLKRNYFFYLPSEWTADGTRTWPLVIVLHGGADHAKRAAKMSGMTSKAEKEGFIVAYPSGGKGIFGRILTWNAWGCCGPAAKRNFDDTGFLRAMIDRLVATKSVDSKRVYVTGFSNGGMLAYKFACENADYVAAAAPIAATVNGVCQPQRPVPMVIFHGMKDKRVRFDGGFGRKPLMPKRDDRSVDNTVKLWANNNQCDREPIRQTNDDVRHDRYTNCKAGADVELYAMKEQGHRWPGWKRRTWYGRNEPLVTNIIATDVMWAFFSRHRLP